MAIHPQLQRFVDDELMRAPLLFDQVLQVATGAIRQDLALGERAFVQALSQHHDELVRQFSASLREQVQADLAAGRGAARAAPKKLSLVDEDVVATDVELSRTVEAIASVAEYELLELRTFTSALVGDVHVARDTNPFRPELYARALWAAASALPVARGFQVALMRHAAMPLAQALRKAYAAACTRLEDAGVEPGTYSTIVLPAGTRTARPSDSGDAPSTDLVELRDTMPAPLDEPVHGAPPLEEALQHADAALRALPEAAGAETRSQALDSQRMRLLGSAPTRVDQQLIELLSRLFDAILSDPSIAPAVQVLLSRLHPSALRVALRDPAMLDSFEHPVWQFIDRIAFGAELHPDENDPLRAKLLGYVRSLVDNMVHEPVQDAALFRWGLGRLLALEKHLFEQRRSAATAQIDSLRAMTEQAADTTGALDVGTLETVPAALLAHDDAPQAVACAPLALEPGQWAQLFLQGRWRVAQLLWHDEAGALWLFADGVDGTTWALKRAALDRLHAEGLLDARKPASLVQRAAASVLRAFPPASR